MFLEINFKKGLLLLIFIGIIINILSYYEAKLRQVTEPNIVIITFHSLVILYLLFSIFNEKNKTKKVVYFALLPLVIIELIFRGFHLYQIAPSMDVLTHYFGGIAIFAIFLLGFNLNIKLTVILGIITILGWEGGELLFDRIFPLINSGFYKDTFFWNGAKDIIFHLLGMLTVFLFVRKTKNLKK